MNFEIGKQYIVSVSENGIIPIEEFSNERYFDIEYDSIDFLTDEEKIVIINDVLDKIRAEIADIYCGQYCENPSTADSVREMALEIIDKYKEESEEEADNERV